MECLYCFIPQEQRKHHLQFHWFAYNTQRYKTEQSVYRFHDIMQMQFSMYCYQGCQWQILNGNFLPENGKMMCLTVIMAKRLQKQWLIWQKVTRTLIYVQISLNSSTIVFYIDYHMKNFQYKMKFHCQIYLNLALKNASWQSW